MTKQEMTKEIKSLRKQMVDLKEMMETREDKLFRVIDLISPFMPVLLSTDKERKRFLDELESDK